MSAEVAAASATPDRGAPPASCAVDVVEGSLTWRVDAEWREAVVAGVIRRLDAIRSGGAEVVKHNRMRTVYRVELPGPRRDVVYLKVHRTPTFFEQMKSVVVSGRARTEWRVMTQFREARIPTARPLAIAERRSLGVLRESYFVTEAIANASDLVPFMRHAFPDRPRGGDRTAKRRFLSRLASGVRSMHDAGLYYSDLHSGNILVQGDDPANARLHFIDLHTGRRREHLSSRARLTNLSRLCHSLLEVTNRPERLRFLESYAGGDPILGRAIRAAFRRSEARVLRLERRRLVSRALRCVVESSRFTRLRARGLSGFAQRAFPESFWRDVVVGHTRLIAGDGAGVVFKNGRSTRVTGFEVCGPSGPVRVCVKEYRCPSPLDRLKRLLGYRKARRAWMAGNALLVRGVAAAEPLAFLRGAGPVGSDLLVMRDVSDLPRLDHLVFERLPGAPSPERRRLAAWVAAFIKDLHDRGVYHNDLKACNVLVAGVPGAPEGRPSFVLIDFDGARCTATPVIERRRIKNLAQLSASIPEFVTLAERFRFFRAYSRGRLSREARRRYYRGVIRACRRKILVKERAIE